MLLATLLRFAPTLARLVPPRGQLRFLLAKYDREKRIYYSADASLDYDNTNVYVRAHDSLPQGALCLVEEVNRDVVRGILAGPAVSDNIPIDIPLPEVSDDQFEIRYFYKNSSYKFLSLEDAYRFVRSNQAARIARRNEKYEPHLLSDIRFGNRMDVLQLIAQLSEELYANERTSLSTVLERPVDLPISVVGLTKEKIMDRLYADYGPDVQVTSWPTYARLNHRMDMVLASLLDDGDLIRGGDEPHYFLAPKALVTLAEFEERQVASTEVREQHRQIYWLRLAAVFLAVVGLILTVFQPFIDWLTKGF